MSWVSLGASLASKCVQGLPFLECFSPGRHQEAVELTPVIFIVREASNVVFISLMVRLELWRNALTINTLTRTNRFVILWFVVAMSTLFQATGLIARCLAWDEHGIATSTVSISGQCRPGVCSSLWLDSAIGQGLYNTHLHACGLVTCSSQADEVDVISLFATNHIVKKCINCWMSIKK